jgi:predicted GNAT family acetyltransferase
VARTPTLPADWHLNHVHVAATVTFEEASRLADEHLGGLRFRHLEIEDRAGGQGLEESFRQAGWEVEHEVVLALARPPANPPEETGIVEPSEEQMLTLMRRWIIEDEIPRPDALDEHVESVRRRARASGERHFGIGDSGGRLLAMTNLRSDGTIAQVENVYTAPEARGRGYARALVAHVTALAVDAGHELTFITADDDGWPKTLYERLGFEPVGWTWLFHRRV